MDELQQPQPTTPEPAVEPESGCVSDYLKESHRRFGLQQLTHVQALSFFLPLLREMFNAGESKTKVVFSILHALMVDERVRWTRQELDEKFHWLRDVQRNYLLHRLSNVGWLEYFRDQSSYMLSDKGEALMRILSRFAYGQDLAANEGAALAEIEFSQMLEFPDLPERLKFLRNRLRKHIIRAEAALSSHSAYRILEIYEQLKSAYRWAEQTRRTLDHLDFEDEDENGWQTVRGVHDNLSRLHSLISEMQLALQDIQRRQIDIARYGLTHLDFDNYLIHSDIDVLADMVVRHLSKAPHPFLSVDANLFQEAAEIIGRRRDSGAVPRSWDTDVAPAQRETGSAKAPEMEDFLADLKGLPAAWRPLQSLVRDESWEIAAYRFSLLTLLADRQPDLRVSEFDPLMQAPAAVAFDAAGELESVEREDGQWQLTRGRVRTETTRTAQGAE